MTDKIREHLDYLLKDAPKTKRILEMREELLSGCYDKYEDLTASGTSPEDAYTAVISGIGNVDELVASLSEESVFDPEKAERKRQTKALMISFAVMLYIVSVVSVVFFSQFGLEELGITGMFILAGMATALIIYANMAHEPRYEKKEDTIVEEVKVVLTAGGATKEKRLRGAASSSLWCLITLTYLFLGFTFNLWHPCWILFPFGACLQSLLNAALSDPLKRDKHITTAVIMGSVCLFLILGFATSLWYVAWLVILFAISIQQIFRLVRIWREER